MAETVKRPRGRPRTGFDKKEYDREYHLKRRAKEREAKAERVVTYRVKGDGK